MNIANALAALGAALKAADLLQGMLQTARQNSEMTPEQEQEFDAHVAQRMAMPHWQGRNPQPPTQ